MLDLTARKSHPHQKIRGRFIDDSNCPIIGIKNNAVQQEIIQSYFSK